MSQTTQRKLAERYGPWAVVTGASDGIGRDFARRLAEAGVQLVLVARRPEVLDALATELAGKHGVRTRVLPLDLARPESAQALASATADLDVGLLVAAAGFGTSGPFLDSDLARELEMLQVNCASVTALCHHFGRRFAQRRRGGIVLMSSLLAFQGVPGSADYAATKAYVQTLAEALHVELAPLGVDVLACAPGPVKRASRHVRACGTPPAPFRRPRSVARHSQPWADERRSGLAFFRRHSSWRSRRC